MIAGLLKIMSERSRREQKELPDVQLRIVPPNRDKNFMIAFDGKTKQECVAYNNALKTVLKRHDLSPFHQVGTTPFGSNEPGEHAWEIWRDATEEKLTALLPEILDEAKKNYPIFEGYDD